MHSTTKPIEENMREISRQNIGQAKQFAIDLQEAGVASTNYPEVAERISEAVNWRFALVTLVKAGKRINIEFKAAPSCYGKICALLSDYGFDSERAKFCAETICMPAQS